MTEKWEQIKKYPQYEISSLGRIRHIKHQKIRKFRVDTQGYYAINLGNKATGTQDTLRVHRLMGIVFLGASNSNEVVDHINRNRQDNSLANLRLVTQKQNMSNKTINKLTVRKIIALHTGGYSLDEIVAMVCY